MLPYDSVYSTTKQHNNTTKVRETRVKEYELFHRGLEYTRKQQQQNNSTANDKQQQQTAARETRVKEYGFPHRGLRRTRGTTANEHPNQPQQHNKRSQK
jgi:hypothetical protein